MKKENVFVVIDTRKKAEKASKVLAMFNQKLASELLFKYCLQNNGWLHISKLSNTNKWVWSVPESHLTKNDKEVSVSELKQILAMEHIKSGDVVVCRKEKDNFNIFEVSYTDSYYIYYKRRFSSKDGLGEYSGAWFFENFHRYATEEEKQLLNPPVVKEDEKHTGSFESLRNLKCDTVDFPNDFKEVEKDKKDLEVGKWYFVDRNDTTEHKALVIFKGHNVDAYGFSHKGLYTDNYGCYNTFCNPKYQYTKATQEQVAERFFKETRKRYPNHIGYVFNHGKNEIFTGSEIVFKNGTWLEAKKIEIDPFKELKEAHKKGFEIEYKSSSGQWKTSSNPAWRKTGNYRIRPVKIGDWFLTTHEQTNVKYYYQVNETNINYVRGNHVRILNQMVIDILNNGKYTV